MPAQSGNMISWTYTDDNGKEWRVAARKAITDQLEVADVKVGGSAGDPADDKLPRYIRPRKRYVVAADGTRRGVVCYTTSAPLWTTPGITITLMHGADGVVFTYVKGKYAERSFMGTDQSA